MTKLIFQRMSLRYLNEHGHPGSPLLSCDIGFASLRDYMSVSSSLDVNVIIEIIPLGQKGRNGVLS
jgi:hypothetical protein